MSRKLTPRWVMMLLVAAVLILPIAIAVILSVSALLGAMGDTTGSCVLRYIGWGCGILWVIGLISLVLVQGLESLVGSDEADE